MSKKIEKSMELGGKKLTLSTGHFAQQATSAVMARYGETVVMATVVSAPLKEDLGYIPLTVEYQERLYAGGRIKGSRWVKREGRPSDDEILTARLIDRSIRPLFPKTYNKDVQIIVTVLSVDLENTPDIVALAAVSSAIEASSIPWQGPSATVRVGRKDNKFITNPHESEIQESDLDLIVSSTDKAVVMIEAGAKEVSEKDMISAITFAHDEGKKLIKFIKDFASLIDRKKEALPKNTNNLGIEKKIKEETKNTLKDILVKLSSREIGYTEYDEYKFSVVAQFSDSEQKLASNMFEEFVAKEIKGMLLLGKRLDGRKPEELRKLSAEVEVLPRTHGSAMFKRGETQVLTVATLGPPSMEQLIESAEGEESKSYIHHYSMPPYSIGETGRVGYPSRREIGHGALAERALLPVLPSDDVFPYTIRVVTEVLSSNGSTSMASTCGSTLSLMDAGVPISSPVAGIAMGLVIDESSSSKKSVKDESFVVLTDITGIEDGNGDMDFKVAGTKEGITALQLDVKTLNLTVPIIKTAFDQAKDARLKILAEILKTIPEPRAKVSTHAPKIKVIKVPQDKIGEVIGPGGKMIKSIIADTGAQVDIEDDGTVNVSGMTDEEVDKAIDKIELLTKEVKAGEIYEGMVKRLEPFGAFVEIFSGRDGMVHVSDMSTDFVKDPKDILKLGDKVKVRVKEIDNMGRINLSMLLSKDMEKPKNRFSDKGPRKFPRSDHRSSGPHFPASRFVDAKKKKY